MAWRVRHSSTNAAVLAQAWRRGALVGGGPNGRTHTGGNFERVTTDFQTAREALDARLRELRAEAGLEGKELPARLGWQTSKVSRLQNGQQTPSRDD